MSWVLLSVRGVHVVRLPKIRPWGATLLCTVVSLLVLAAPASGYSRSPCESGVSYPVAASNDAGETLVAWQQARGEERGLCFASAAMAAVGSAKGGFPTTSTVSAPGDLSFPTGAFIDDDGDAWVVGVDEHEVPGGHKYEVPYDRAGAWVTFRPAGGDFRAPVQLPTGRAPVDSVLIAGDRSGATLLAWSSERGTYIAWGTATGTISRTTFIGKDFTVSSVGVDERGEALIVGYYPDPRLEGADSIAVLSSLAFGRLSRPHIVARRGRYRTLGLPVLAVGPNGSAIIAWEAPNTPEFGSPSPTPDMLIYRTAKGRFNKPIRFADNFLHFPGRATFPHSNEAVEPELAAVDSAGRAVIVTDTEHGVEEMLITSHGRADRRRRVGGTIDDDPALASNTAGLTTIAWPEGSNGTIDVVSGNIRGTKRQLQNITAREAISSEPVVPVMNAEGGATVVWIEKANAVRAQGVAPGAPTATVFEGL